MDQTGEALETLTSVNAAHSRSEVGACSADHGRESSFSAEFCKTRFLGENLVGVVVGWVERRVVQRGLIKV